MPACLCWTAWRRRELKRSRFMHLRVIPGRFLLAALAAGAIALTLALSFGASPEAAALSAGVGLSALTALAIFDWLWSVRAWRAAAPSMTRRLPAAFALGVEERIALVLAVGGANRWRAQLFDHTDPSLAVRGTPRV